MGCGAVGVTFETLFVDPMLKAGGCEKLKPPPVATGWADMAGDGAELAAFPAPPPKVNTPLFLFGVPKALAPPNWKPPWPGEGAEDPKTGVALGCWPKTGAALGLAPKAGDAALVAENEGAGDPKAGAAGWDDPCPKAGA